MIKAIETSYNGYRFRSRLEARWAVFLDAAGVEYKYEPEGYKLDGVCYLPDFWLPGLDCWFEVKGGQITDDASHKAYMLCRGTHKVVIVAGDHFNGKRPDHMWRFFYLDGYTFHGVCNNHDAAWAQCGRCNMVAPVVYEMFISSYGSMEGIPLCPCGPRTEDFRQPDAALVLSAYAEARRARFERTER